MGDIRDVVSTYLTEAYRLSERNLDCSFMYCRKAVEAIGPKNWRRISTEFLQGKRSDVQCLHRWRKVLRPGLVKGPWTKDEDKIIIDCIKLGVSKWSEIAERIPGRIGKQCRERWFNHLDPKIKRTEWS